MRAIFPTRFDLWYQEGSVTVAVGGQFQAKELADVALRQNTNSGLSFCLKKVIKGQRKSSVTYTFICPA